MTAPASSPARELGIPVRSVNWVRLHPGRDAQGRPSLLASMGQDAGNIFVCDIDLQTGHCQQLETPITGANFTTAAYRCPDSGVLYLGSSYAGHLHRYDPNTRKLEDVGAINPELASFPCRIDRAPDGKLYIGSYGGCSLDRFDPATGEWKHYGRMDETDMYFYPLCGADGTVAGLVKMCRQHVVAIDRESGERRSVGPVIDTDQQEGNIELVKGCDGLLYIQSSKGNFALRGLEAQPVDKLPEPMPPDALPDGTAVAFVDANTFIHRQVRLTAPDGSVRDLHLDWRSKGTNIFSLTLGPDGRLYGSSVLPEHLFSADLDGGHMRDHGPCSVSGGEVYSFANLDGKLYLGSYPAARLSVYDPRRPYQFGTEEGSNPRDLGRPDKVAYRPRAMLAGPAGKVWIASVPDYGMWGGTLAWYDPAAGAFGSHRHIVRDCSPVSLALVEKTGQLLVGTEVAGGTGTTPRAETCAFVLWDPRKDEAVWQGDLGIPDLAAVSNLAAAKDGTVFAVVSQWADPSLPLPQRKSRQAIALIDAAERKLIDLQPFAPDFEHAGWFGERCFSVAEDGTVYAASHGCLWRLDEGSAVPHPVWRPAEGHIEAPGPMVGGTFYYADKYRLMAAMLPG